MKPQQKPDPVNSLLDGAREAKESLEFWLGCRLGELVGELEEAGIELEDIPKELADYAAWMRANIDMFQVDWSGVVPVTVTKEEEEAISREEENRRRRDDGLLGAD